MDKKPVNKVVPPSLTKEDNKKSPVSPNNIRIANAEIESKDILGKNFEDEKKKIAARVQGLEDKLNEQYTIINYYEAEKKRTMSTITNLEAELYGQRSIIEEKHANIENLTYKINDLNAKVEEKDANIENLTYKINDLNAKVEEKDANIELLSTKLEEKNKTIENLNNEIKELLSAKVEESNKIIENLTSKVQENNIIIENLNSKIEEKNANIEILSAKVKENNTTIETLNSELMKSKEFRPYLEFNQEKINETEYDCVININKFQDIAVGGWELEFPRQVIENSSEFTKIKDEIGSSQGFLSVTGSYDKGKTFLINYICESFLPFGKKIETKGISFKKQTVKETTNVIVIDTAGIHSPIDLSTMTIEEKKNTEKRIRDIVFLLSDFFIVVVNDFTTLDQEILQKLEKQIKGNKKKKFREIIVVHNLKDVYTENMMEAVWDRQVLKIYCLDSGKSSIQITTLDSGKSVRWLSAPFTRHLLLINDNCDFGKEFNKNSISLLKNWIVTICTGYENKNIFDQIFNIINRDIDSKTEEHKNQNDTPRNDNLAIYENKDLNILKTESPGKLLLKYKNPEDKPLIAMQNGFEPIFDIIETHEKYIIILDMPGVKQTDLNITYTENRMTIVDGIRQRDFEGESHDSLRTFGKFVMKFKIPSKYQSEFENAELENGTLRLEYIMNKPKKALFNLKKS